MPQFEMARPQAPEMPKFEMDRPQATAMPTFEMNRPQAPQMDVAIAGELLGFARPDDAVRATRANSRVREIVQGRLLCSEVKPTLHLSQSCAVRTD